METGDTSGAEDGRLQTDGPGRFPFFLCIVGAHFTCSVSTDLTLGGHSARDGYAFLGLSKHMISSDGGSEYSASRLLDLTIRPGCSFNNSLQLRIVYYALAEFSLWVTFVGRDAEQSGPEKARMPTNRLADLPTIRGRYTGTKMPSHSVYFSVRRRELRRGGT